MPRTTRQEAKGGQEAERRFEDSAYCTMWWPTETRARKSGRIAGLLSARSNGSPSATPTAVEGADQPTSLSAPLVHRSLALPAPYPLAHTCETTSTSNF